MDDSRYYIEYAKLESSRCYTPPITYNVEKLKAAIVLAKNATGQGQVILIAHSMGGVVSRAYLEGPDYAGDVAALFTFGSPHEGIPEGALVQWINLFTASGIGSTGLSLYCATFQPAMCDLSTTGMFVFNSFLSGGKPADMTYHLVSGNAPLSSRNFAGLLMNQFYLFTPNDGIIPTGSGKADQLFAGLDIDRHETDETHGPGTGVFGPNTYFVRENNDPIRSYEECLKPVLADRTSATCMTIASAQTLLQVAFAPAKHASSQLMAQAVSVSPQRTTVQYATLSTGQSATRTIYLEGGPATFVSYWQASTLAVTLIDPNGQMIDPAFAAEHPEIVSYTADSKGAIYSLVNAIPGAWQLVAQATSTPAGGIGYANFAVLESDVSMTGEVNRRWYAPGDSATISATLSGLPTNTAITAKIFRADGAIDIVSFSPLGAGQYAGTYVIPNVPGYAEARLFATGVTARGVPFERETSLLFQISPDSFALNGMYSDAPQPRPFNPLRYQALTVAVGVNATVSGAVGLSADLVDTGGNPVAHAVTIQEVTPGSVTLNLRFDGDDIFASQRDGPYTLTNLLLLDMRSAALVAANAENVHTTTAYHWQDFGGDDAPDTQAGAIQVSANNTNLRYYIAPVGDEDWFRFRLNGIGNPQVHLTSLPANYDLYVYDAEGRLLGSSNKGGKAAELVVVSRALPGDYYVRVVGVNGESDERNPYQLRFNVPGTGGP